MPLEYITELNADLSGKSEPPQVALKQGDVNGRILLITLLNNGQPYTIPAATIARVGMTKPDGEQILNDATITGGKVKVVLTQQMLAVAGDAQLDIQLYNSSNNVLLSSANIYLRIYPMANKQTAVDSSAEYQAFQAGLLRLDEAIGESETAAEQAELAATGANAAANAANTAAITAQLAAGAANDVAADLEQRRDNGDFRGDSGIQASTNGMYTLYVNGSGRLIAQYPDETFPPPLELIGGHLVYLTDGDGGVYVPADDDTYNTMTEAIEAAQTAAADAQQAAQEVLQAKENGDFDGKTPVLEITQNGHLTADYSE